MVFFDLDSKWKIWIYRIGLISNIFSLLGLILIGANAYLHRGGDILKRKKNPKFNGIIEKYFYLIGYVAVAIITFQIISIVFFGLL
ncbi:MAG: hypothetical protein IH934_05660 [Nanoarchaeota archaeon]|nr:hypothetical protein [Nanoarchaeota archaeon]